MKLYSTDFPGRNRSIVWLTVGCFLALAVIFCLAGLGLWQFSPNWHRSRWLTIINQTVQPESAVANPDQSSLTERGARTGKLRPITGTRTTRDGIQRATAVVRPGDHTNDWDNSPPIIATNDDDDAALFAALERLECQMATAIARARESVVALEYTAPDAPPGTRRVATGVVISPRGDVLSVHIDPPPALPNPMAASHLSRIIALDFSGHRHSVHWVATDPETGLTLLRIAPRAVRPIRSTSTVPNLGSQAFVVGNPFGMGHSISRGHVAGLERALDLGDHQLGGLIQIQAPLYPGDSGAAVVNLHGDWLGLIRSGLATSHSDSQVTSRAPQAPVLSPSGFAPSLTATEVLAEHPEHNTDFGFAIPVRDALWVADQLRTEGRVDRAYLGVRLEPLLPTSLFALSKSEQALGQIIAISDSTVTPLSTESRLGDAEVAMTTDNEGAILREVLVGTPASKAGLRPGDRIIELDRQPIRSAHDLTDRLDRIRARATIILGIVRGSGSQRQRIALSLCTASRPAKPRGSAPTPPTPSLMAATTKQVAPTTSAAGTGIVATAPLVKSGIQPGGLPTLPLPQPDALSLTLPRAVVDRLEKLERRLEKLESFPPHTSGPASASDPQISSARHP